MSYLIREVEGVWRIYDIADGKLLNSVITLEDAMREVRLLEQGSVFAISQSYDVYEVWGAGVLFKATRSKDEADKTLTMLKKAERLLNDTLQN